MPTFLSKLFGSRKQTAPALDYDRLVHLDAEDLAEQGIKEAYERLLPELRKYVPEPVAVEEVFDEVSGRYAVRWRGREFVVYSTDLAGSEGESWGRACYAFFHIVNEQLGTATVRLYAVNGGNDLGGLFLTPEQAVSAQANLPRRSDWPYIPTLERPYYGQFH
jgi:hypothetical protein